MPIKSIPLWVLVAIEALLVFALGVLGNKLATLIDISAGPIYFFTLAGIVSLVGVFYLRFGQPSKAGFALSVINQLRQLKERLPLFKPDPFEQYKSEADKYSERSVNAWFIIGFIGGFLSGLGLILPASDSAKLFWCISLMLTSGVILTAYILHSLNVESRIKREEPSTVSIWEVLGVLFLSTIFLIPGWLGAIVFLALTSWAFGISF